MTMEPKTSPIDELVDPSCDYEGTRIVPAMVGADELPAPCRELLAHDMDMTSTLEAYFNESLRLKVLNKRVDGDVMYRQVLLVGCDTGRVVEYGAIHIDLSCFDDRFRKLVEECRVPLGAILRDPKTQYKSEPSAYLRLKAEPPFNTLLGCAPGTELFGRRNILSTLEGKTIARIVEVLPCLNAEPDT